MKKLATLFLLFFVTLAVANGDSEPDGQDFYEFPHQSSKSQRAAEMLDGCKKTFGTFLATPFRLAWKNKLVTTGLVGSVVAYNYRRNIVRFVTWLPAWWDDWAVEATIDRIDNIDYREDVVKSPSSYKSIANRVLDIYTGKTDGYFRDKEDATLVLRAIAPHFKSSTKRKLYEAIEEHSYDDELFKILALTSPIGDSDEIYFDLLSKRVESYHLSRSQLRQRLLNFIEKLKPGDTRKEFLPVLVERVRRFEREDKHPVGAIKTAIANWDSLALRNEVGRFEGHVRKLKKTVDELDELHRYTEKREKESELRRAESFLEWLNNTALPTLSASNEFKGLDLDNLDQYSTAKLYYTLNKDFGKLVPKSTLEPRLAELEGLAKHRRKEALPLFAKIAADTDFLPHDYRKKVAELVAEWPSEDKIALTKATHQVATVTKTPREKIAAIDFLHSIFEGDELERVDAHTQESLYRELRNLTQEGFRDNRLSESIELTPEQREEVLKQIIEGDKNGNIEKAFLKKVLSNSERRELGNRLTEKLSGVTDPKERALLLQLFEEFGIPVGTQDEVKRILVEGPESERLTVGANLGRYQSENTKELKAEIIHAFWQSGYSSLFLDLYTNRIGDDELFNQAVSALDESKDPTKYSRAISVLLSRNNQESAQAAAKLLGHKALTKQDRTNILDVIKTWPHFVEPEIKTLLSFALKEEVSVQTASLLIKKMTVEGKDAAQAYLTKELPNAKNLTPEAERTLAELYVSLSLREPTPETLKTVSQLATQMKDPEAVTFLLDYAMRQFTVGTTSEDVLNDMKVLLTERNLSESQAIAAATVYQTGSHDIHDGAKKAVQFLTESIKNKKSGFSSEVTALRPLFQETIFNNLKAPALPPETTAALIDAYKTKATPEEKAQILKTLGALPIVYSDEVERVFVDGLKKEGSLIRGAALEAVKGRAEPTRDILKALFDIIDHPYFEKEVETVLDTLKGRSKSAWPEPPQSRK